jgi:hypothetical protein
MKKFTLLAAIACFLIACSNNHKTVVVMSKGKADIDLNAKTIKSTDGSGHEEKTLDINSAEISFKLNTPAGEATVDIKENGLYVINVKNDTIIGSYQKYSSAGEANKTITQEKLKQNIDSLKLLVEGKNISTANRNYFIVPNQATKITDNKDAQVVGPYHQMRSAERIDGKDPEIYRFYSIKEIREMIARLEALTVSEVK